VIDSQSETVIGPVVREAIGKQRYARIARDRVGFLRSISDASEQTNFSERLGRSRVSQRSLQGDLSKRDTA
jgi:hypothetical protein